MSIWNASLNMSKKFLNLACGDYFIVSESWVNLDWAPKSKKVIQANLLDKIPFEDNSFDFIYCSHFLEHISKKDILNFLTECNRVLKSNGRARFVLPDFENIAREYVYNMDNNFLKFAEFNILEMIDQCVRKESGGELNQWYKNSFSDPELSRYISKRTGYKLIQNPKNKYQILKKFQNLTLKKIYFTIQFKTIKAIIKLFPKWYRDNYVSTTATGEKHLWVHDFHSVQQILLQSGFDSVIKLNAFTSLELDFPVVPLDVDLEGLPIKGAESMYIEALKI
jgi:ubiquinone/menaquinone biosynthesis C-methylase UbiE